ncbi:32834_t:CDS:2, partial [Racocetra persica]
MRAIPDMTRERISTLLEEGGLDVLPRPGRPKILTQSHERKIARFFKSGQCLNAVQAQKKLVSEE